MELALPSREECEALWEEYCTPPHIREHMKQVARVGVVIAQALNNSGKDVIVDLVERAALLHDTVRVTDWDTLSFEYFPYQPSEHERLVWEQQRKIYPPHIPHAEVNAMLFSGRYPEMARLIRLHSIGSVNELTTWEEKILNYADRRVAHDQVVSIQERLDEAYLRYSKTTQTPLERDASIVSAIYAMEKELFESLPFTPNTLPLV